MALLKEPKKEPTTACDICGESIGYFRLRDHRRKRHPDFVELQHKLAGNLIAVTGPGGVILAILFGLAAWSHAVWAWAAFLVALPVVLGVIVARTFRVTRHLNAFYEKQSLRCQVCLEMIPRTAYRDHVKSFHHPTWILAVRLGVIAFAIILGSVALAGLAWAHQLPVGFDDRTFALIAVVTTLATMLAYVVLATLIWGRHRKNARVKWRESRGRRISGDPLHPP